ncbi:hypothetical protein [Pseudescherichia sp.]|uniref:hypothetical protein n=1 Tax=Pseudescherichia sp. TaxID=2055881 RepID=UPI00289EB5C8|nr:hypothetical protein [Pseudescherichia sp.]
MRGVVPKVRLVPLNPGIGLAKRPVMMELLQFPHKIDAGYYLPAARFPPDRSPERGPDI